MTKPDYDEDGFLIVTGDGRCTDCGHIVHWNVTNEPDELVCDCRVGWDDEHLTPCPKQALMVLDEESA